MKTKNEIIFRIGEENRIIIENIDKEVIQKSIFSMPYRQILEGLHSYLNHLNGLQKTEANNIFAFVGDRGSGKTSCMMSVVNYLEHLKESDLDYGFDEEKFYAMDMVDPSFIDNERNIIGVILAKMYKTFKETNNHDEKARLEMLGLFSNAQKQFYRMLETDRQNEDNLDSLVALSSAIDLKTTLQKLISCYLNYVGKGDAVMIIPIDDIDLHTFAATDMIEQLRKYLVLPNVVILMAVKISQLAMLKRIQYSKEYTDFHHTITGAELNEMVDKYMVKLIPHNHRVYMPDGNYYWNSALIVKKGDSEVCKCDSIRQLIPELIFEKTRFLFYNSPVKTSLIVPSNLRELRQLIRLLVDMKDYWSNEKDGIPENKSIFKKYLFESWMVNHVSSQGQGLLREIMAVADSIQFNAMVLRAIKSEFNIESNFFFASSKFEKNEEEDELQAIIPVVNKIYNVSLGDVLAVVDYLERLDLSYEEQCFLFMIKTLYSLRLYELYDIYTYRENHEQKVIPPKTQTNKGVVLSRGLFDDLLFYDYFKVVGGRYFNTRTMFHFGSPENVPSRLDRAIDVSLIDAMMKTCISAPEEVDGCVVRLLEFFMICTARPFNTKNYKTYDYIDPFFRQYTDVAYAASLKRKPKGFFDVSSFLFNVIDLERCYKRFEYGDQFLALMHSEEARYQAIFRDSLYNQFQVLAKSNLRNMERSKYAAITGNDSILQHIKAESEVYDQFGWASWTCIRNFEILMDLAHYLDELDSKDGYDVMVLKSFFKRMSDYSILSYDLGEGEERYNINFRYARLVYELLQDVEKSQDLMERFNSIFCVYKTLKTTDKKSSVIKVVPNDYRLSTEKLKMFIKGNSCLSRTMNINIKKYYPIYLTEVYRKVLDKILPIDRKVTIKPENIPVLIKEIEAEIEKLKADGNTSGNN